MKTTVPNRARCPIILIICDVILWYVLRPWCAENQWVTDHVYSSLLDPPIIQESLLSATLRPNLSNIYLKLQVTYNLINPSRPRVSHNRSHSNTTSKFHEVRTSQCVIGEAFNFAPWTRGRTLRGQKQAFLTIPTKLIKCTMADDVVSSSLHLKNSSGHLKNSSGHLQKSRPHLINEWKIQVRSGKTLAQNIDSK